MSSQNRYMVHNTVRRVETRLMRAQAPGRPRMNLLLGGGTLRIVRGKHVVIAERMLMKLLPELREEEARGALKVTDMTRRRIDLTTLQPMEEHLPAAPPPHPPLDSAENDEDFGGAGVGHLMPPAPGMKAESEEVPLPSLLGGDQGPADQSEPELVGGADEAEFEPGLVSPPGNFSDWKPTSEFVEAGLVDSAALEDMGTGEVHLPADGSMTTVELSEDEQLQAMYAQEEAEKAAAEKPVEETKKGKKSKAGG